MNMTLLNNKDTTNRLNYIDIARGLSIILMIIGHVVTDGWKRTIIFSFHMPLFIFVSGMFFKENEEFKTFILKLIKKLLISYLMTIIVVYFLKWIIYNEPIKIIQIIEQLLLSYSNKKTFFVNVKGVGVLWFIPFLIISKLIFYAINKFSKDDLTNFFISLLFSIMGMYFAKVKLYLPWSLDIALATSIFYYLGYICKKYKILELIISNYKILVFILFIYTISIKFGYIELAIRSYPYGFMCYITALSGILLIFKISQIIEMSFNYLSKIFQWYGYSSMLILCFHYCEWELIQYSNYGITGKYQLSITKLIIVTTLALIYQMIINIVNKKERHKKGENSK